MTNNEPLDDLRREVERLRTGFDTLRGEAVRHPGEAGASTGAASAALLAMLGERPGAGKRVAAAEPSGGGPVRSLPAGMTKDGGDASHPYSSQSELSTWPRQLSVQGGGENPITLIFSPTFPGLVDDAAAARALDALDRALKHQTGRGLYEMARNS